MSSERTVRLFTFALLVTGAFAWSQSLSAQPQVRVDPRQYEPGRDDSPYIGGDDARSWQDVPAYVSAVEGSAQLWRGGDPIRDFEQVPLEVGDRLSTARGRVEVLFTDGSVIALDENTDITIDDATSWLLQGGRLKVTSRGEAFVVDASPNGAALLRGTGEYRITLTNNRRGEREVELAVTRGSAELQNALGRTAVRPGTRALTTASYAPSVPYAFDTPRDDFERWAERQEAERYGVESSRYLPVELRTYGGEFDRHGYWSNHSSYGWVWYPRVAVGWQPYRTGRWSFVVDFGYSWVGGSRWEWPTHHYGRWDRAGSQWFWVPSRPTVARRVGFAVPRSSYAAPVSYYNVRNTRSSTRDARPTRSDFTQPRQAQRPTSNQPRTQPQAPRAVPRTQSPSSRPSEVTRPTERQATRPAERPTERQTERPSARPAPRQSTPDSRPSAPAPATRQAPAPERSAPPRTGSRTPNAGRAPSSPSRQPSGTAVRRGGGRG
jgi:hypothetical protein